MADRNRARSLQMNPDERAHLELSASRHDLSRSLTRQVEFLVKQLNLVPEDAAARVREKPYFPPEEQEAEQISWYEIANLMESEPDRGERLWERIKHDALTELETGIRSAKSVEPKVGERPIDRARFLAILSAFTLSLAPRDPLEELLIHQMACAYEMHLFWQERASLRAYEEEWQGNRDRENTIRNLSPRQRDRYELDHGWMPPRVSTAEAIDQSVLIAERYQRSFLRLLKAFRDTRRTIGTVVLAGGQLNIAEKQSVTNQVFAK